MQTPSASLFGGMLWLLGIVGATEVAAAPREPFTVYVTNEMSGELTVIDGATQAVVGRIALGKRPRGIASTADGSKLFVALSGSPLAPPGVDESKLPPPDKAADGIGIVDARSLRLQQVVRGVSDPEQLAVSADGKRFYIASEDTGRAVIIDALTGNQLASLDAGGEPEGAALSPDGLFVYITSEEHHTVAVIDTRGPTLLTSVEVGERPRDVAFSPDGKRAYVTGENDASLTIIDARTHRSIGRVKLAGDNVRPKGVVVSPDGGRVYVSTGRGGTVSVIDTKKLAEVKSIRVGARPWGIALSPDGSRLYTANGPSNDVSIIDTATLTTIATVKAGDRPWGVIAVASPPPRQRVGKGATR